MTSKITCPFCGAPTEYISLKAVARLMGKSKATVKRYVQQGRFPGTIKVEGVTTPWIYKIPVSAVLPLVEDNSEYRA